MGYEIKCRLTSGGRADEGIARLEQKALRFHGERRLVIPLKDVSEVHSRGGSLFLTFQDRRAVLDIGPDAAKWASRIASPPSRAEKLGIKAGMRVALINLEDPELEEEVATRGATKVRSTASGLDLIFFGASSPADLESLPALASRLAPSGALWLIREKGKGAPVGEAQSMAAGKRAGLVDIKVVSFSDTASAEKYVIPVAKRARAVRSPSAPRRTSGSVPSRDRT